jgi:uncharacterized protein YraI
MRKFLIGLLAVGAIMVVPDTPALAAGGATVASPGRPLNVRAGAAVWAPRVRTVRNGTPVAIACQVHGQLINQGSTRVTDMWDRLSDGTYVSDAWIRRTGPVPPCGSAPAGAARTAAVPAGTAGTVSSGAIPLKARTGPAHGNPLVSAYPSGTALTLVCQLPGQPVAGDVRTTNRWDRLGNGSYVSDAYVRRSATPPPCGAAAPVPVAAPAPTGVWVHPLPGFPASHSFRTPANPNHIGVDIMSFTGTPVHAAAAGRVLEVVCNISPGASCDTPGSAAVKGCGWYVKVLHAGGVATLYCHLVHRPPVQVGQQVQAGQVIGYVGSSGNSSAPHLHFEVHLNAPPTGPQNAVDPIPFMRARGIQLDRR